MIPLSPFKQMIINLMLLVFWGSGLGFVAWVLYALVWGF